MKKNVDSSATEIQEGIDFQDAGKIEWEFGDFLEGWMTEFGNGVTEMGRRIHG